MRLTRVSDQPIMTSRKDVSWEEDAVFNTAAVYADGKVHLLYRAISHPGWKRGVYNKGRYDSCIGHAVSTDGIHFERFDEPVLRFDSENNGHHISDPEDPRVTPLEGKFYMTYCDWDLRYCQTAIAESSDLHEWKTYGVVCPPETFGMNKNAAIFPEKVGGRYAMLHRPEPREFFDPTKPFDWYRWTRDSDHPGGVRMSYSDDLKNWSYEEKVVLLPRPGKWDDDKVGMAGSPMKTEQGWLVVYHGVDKSEKYRLGIMLLDLEDPSIVLKRQDEPILEPELPWEIVGDVPNVVFSNGGFLMDNELWVYYGGADTVIALAKADVTEFLKG